MKIKNTEGYDSRGKRLIRALFAQGKFIFNYEDAAAAADSVGIPKKALVPLLSNLSKRHSLKRIRKGLYALVDPLSKKPLAHPFAIATRLIEPSAVSHWSALQYHGFTEQIPQVVMISAPRKLYTPSMRQGGTHKKHDWNIDGARYESRQLKLDYFFGIEQVWIDDRFQISITDKERTILDMFANPSLFGGIGEVLAITEQALPSLDIKKLVAYAVRYHQKALCKRIGFVLEHLGVDTHLLKPLLSMPVTTYYPLAPELRKIGFCNKRWRVVENLKL